MASQNFQHFYVQRIDFLFILLIFLSAVIPRIFLYHTEFWRSPDPIEYINVAKNINSGKGLTQSIKWSFFDNSPVVTSALKGRPILTSLFFALLLRINNDVYFLQAFGLFLMSLSTILFYTLARHFYSPKVSFLGAFLVAINPNLLITNRLIVSESIFAFFVLVFFIVLYAMRKNLVRYLLLGFIAGLAFLARLEGFLLLLTLILLEGRKNKLILLSMLSFFVVTFPYFLLNFKINHNPFYNYNSYHFQVYHFSEGMWEGYGKSFPNSITFVKNNFSWILISVTKLLIYNIKSLASLPFLGFLTIIYFLRTRDILRGHKPLFLFSLFYLITLSIIWSGYAEPERHFIIIYPLLLLPLFLIFKKPTFKSVAVILFSMTFVIYMVFDVHRVLWTRTIEPHIDNWGVENKKNIYGWLKNNTQPQNIIASSNPWMTYLFTDRPSIILPVLTRDYDVEKFIKEYHVDYVLTQYGEKSIFKKTATVVYINNGVGIYCYAPCGSF